MNVFSLLITIIIVLFLVFITFKKHMYKLKNYSYNVGSSFIKNETEYYIAYQPKHGTYLRAKKLQKKYKYFLKEEILALMNSTFKDPEDAESALIAFKNKLKSL
jgi:hypothetical protein